MRSADHLRAALVEERALVERQLAELGEREGDEVEISSDEGFADSAQATAERSELLSLIDQLHQTRAEIDDALRRMAEGTYGTCERCGAAIPPERLEAIPRTRLCVACKQAERAR